MRLVFNLCSAPLSLCLSAPAQEQAAPHAAPSAYTTVIVVATSLAPTPTSQLALPPCN